MTTPAVLFVAALVYGPVLRWAVVQRRAEARPSAPLQRIPEWACYAGPVSPAMARRLEASEVEEWLESVRSAWDGDLAEVAERLRARVGRVALDVELPAPDAAVEVSDVRSAA